MPLFSAMLSAFCKVVLHFAKSLKKPLSKKARLSSGLAIASAIGASHRSV